MQHHTTAEQALARIEHHLSRQQTHFTLPEAAALSGLSIAAVRDALEVCLHKYVCRLQVSEQGDLIYNFGPTLRRRDTQTWGERLHEVGAWLWKLFTVLYKAWIALTLVLYCVVFAVMMLALLLASSSRRSDERQRSRSSSPLDMEGILRLFMTIFQWRVITGSIGYRYDRQGYRYRHYQPQPGVWHPQQKHFITAVYDFVFGPPRVPLDPLQNAKEVAAYLQQHKGLIVAAELCALAGWTFAQAETFLTDCVIRYQGETHITDNAVLYSQFDRLMRGVGSVAASEIVSYWDEYEPEYEFTGNSTFQNWLIGGMNCVNLLGAVLVLNGLFDGLLQGQLRQFWGLTSASSVTWLSLGLGWLPLLFSVLFFCIPLGRLLRLRTLQRRRHRTNIRKRLSKAIFARQGQPQSVAQIVTRVHSGGQEETLTAAEGESLLKELALDMPGDMLVNDLAEIQFSFPRLTRELQEVEKLRLERRVDDRLGQIIIESDNQ